MRKPLSLVVGSIDEAARVLVRGRVKSVRLKMAAPTERQMAAIRCSRNEATDADRILLARPSKDGRTMIGPDEVVPCDRHDGQTEIHRWAWPVPADGDHLTALEVGGDGQIVHGCPDCEIEAEERYQEEIAAWTPRR